MNPQTRWLFRQHYSLLVDHPSNPAVPNSVWSKDAGLPDQLVGSALTAIASANKMLCFLKSSDPGVVPAAESSLKKCDEVVLAMQELAKELAQHYKRAIT
jgi:hypothetical protein